MGIEALVEGLGLPLTWSMAVLSLLDVLLLLISAFFLQIKSSLISEMHFLALFCICYSIFVQFLNALFVHFLCTFYARFVRLLCTCYARFIHFLCAFYALFIRP